MGSIEFKTIVVILISNAILFVVMSGLIGKIWGRKQLKSKEYPNPLIQVQVRNNDRWGYVFLSTLIGSQILSILILILMGQEITIDFYLSKIVYIAVASMLAAALIAYPFLNKRYKMECKEAAIQSGSEIVIDFNYEGLKLMLNRWLESAALLLMLYFNIRYLENNVAVYAYACLPWLFYFIMRNTKYQVQQSIAYTYKVIGIVMIIYQTLKAVIFTLVMLRYSPDNPAAAGFFNQVLLGTLYLIFAATILFGIVNYPKLKKIFQTHTSEQAT
jgi:hypothetical protein